MLDRTLLALIIYIASAVAGLTALSNADAQKPRKQLSSSTEIATKTQKLTISQIEKRVEKPKQQSDPAETELRNQMSNPQVPQLAYWERVAECETNLNWQNGGQWAGGLGIFTRGKFRDANMGTWERYGGEEFAAHPSGATKTEQIVVANRIAVLGYEVLVVRNPEKAKIKGVPPTYVWTKPAFGYKGWGCIRNTVGSPVEWAKRQSD